MTDPIDIHALKAAALDPTKHRTHDDRVMMVARSDVLALIERLERAEAVAEYARSREMPTTEKQVKAAEMFFTAPMMARLEKLEAVAEHARELRGTSDRLDRALAALEAP